MTEVVNLDSLRSSIVHDHGEIPLSESLALEWCKNSGFNQGVWNLSSLSISGSGQLISNSTDIIINSLQAVMIQLVPTNDPMIIAIEPYKDALDKTYLKLRDALQFEKLISNLLIWTKLKPEGLSKKWTYEKSIVDSDKSYGNELLVCRFKVYGPIPSKVKNLNIVQGPAVPFPNGEINTGNPPNEDWFMAMGHLKPNGMLDLLLESDGSLLYSINVSILFNSEIRQPDHSIFQNSNILYLGFINELRSLNSIKPLQIIPDQSKQFIVPSSKGNVTKTDLINYQNTTRIIIEFPLHIDLEDWFVTVSSFTKREYIADTRRFLKSKRLRTLQKVQVDIVEAKFDDTESFHKRKLYTELVLWNSPWFRTSIVETYKDNSFWRETFKFDLPISTQYFQLLIKESTFNEEYKKSDKVIGTLYVTPDMLDPLKAKDIDRLTIFDSNNYSIGKMLINLNQTRYFILPLEEYKIFEKMIINVPFEELIDFIKPLANTLERLEEYSIMFVDIFQTLDKENEWLLALMDHELHPVDALIRSNRMKGNQPNKTVNMFNTLFRGNSMLTKSLEKFNFRVGQEYLEKTIGEFVNKVSLEAFDCEIDPRMIEVDDEEEKQKILADHNEKLMNYVSEIWNMINETSNDLPKPIKTQMTKFRLKIENSVEPTDTITPLNSLSLFIFLRFFCPAILNPKLFYLTKNHQTGDVQRTLTLITKILLSLANRSAFVEHKEPYLMSFNSFISDNETKMLEYFDKITDRKLDFQPKILELSDDVTRPSLNIPKEISEELPTNPYMIDKYLRIVELINLISAHRLESRKNSSSSATRPNLRKSVVSSLSSEQLYKIHTIEDHDENFFSDIEEIDDQNLIKADNFIKNLLESSDDFDDLVKSNLKLQDLQNQANLILIKTDKLVSYLSRLELPRTHDWSSFADEILSTCFVNSLNKKIYLSDDISKVDHSKYKSIKDGGLNLKISAKNSHSKVSNGIIRSASTSTFKLGESKRNPFRKFFGKKNNI